MITAFKDVADLPRKSATEVKTRWGSVIREAHETGPIAVTSRKHIEVVVVSVEHYQELIGLAAPRHASLDLLAERFQARLERMKAGAIQAGATAFMDDDGDFSKMENPPLVGPF